MILPRRVTLVCGAGSSGKTSFAIRYLLNAPIQWRFVFDPDGEYSERLRLTPAETGIDLDAHLLRGWIVFDPHTLFPGRLDQAFLFFAEWVYTIAERLPGRKLFLVDEIWRYISPHNWPIELGNIVQTGRKRQLETFLLTQTPQNTPGNLKNEITELVCFNLQFDRSLEYVAGFGHDPAEIRALPPLHYVSRGNTGGELRGRITF